MNKPAETGERDEAIEQAVVMLLNAAVVGECKMCGSPDDDHALNCAVPFLEEWVNPS